MKYLLYVAAFAAFAVSWPRLSAAERHTRESLGLIGPVHVLVESDVADVSPSNQDGDAFNSRTTMFSPEGYVIEIENCVPPDCEHTTFLRQGPWVVEEQNKSGLEVKTTRYLRNADGRVLEEHVVEDYLNGGSSSCVKTYTDGELGKEELQRCDDDAFSSRRVAQQQGETGTEIVFLYRYENDPNGGTRWVLDARHTVLSEQLPDGSTRKESKFGKGRSVATTDAQGRVIEEIDDFPPAFHRMTHIYDRLGREVERAEWERNGNVINRRTYSYDNDAHGNWTRKAEFFWSPAYLAPVAGEVTIRKIEYY